MILDLGGELVDINYIDPAYGLSSLGWICHGYGDLRPDLLDLVLSRGANPLLLQGAGETFLHLAIRTFGRGIHYFEYETSRIFFVRLMNATAKAKTLEQGIETLTLEGQLGLLTKDGQGQTALDLARKLRFTRQKVFWDALAQCGVSYTLCTTRGMYPAKFRFRRACDCPYGFPVLEYSSMDGNFSKDNSKDEGAEKDGSEDADSETYLFS